VERCAKKILNEGEDRVDPELGPDIEFERMQEHVLFAALLLEFVAGLPERIRRIVILQFLESRGAPEIACVLRRSAGMFEVIVASELVRKVPDHPVGRNWPPVSAEPNSSTWSWGTFACSHDVSTPDPHTDPDGRCGYGPSRNSFLHSNAPIKPAGRKRSEAGRDARGAGYNQSKRVQTLRALREAL
jgi:hypothetical protein